MDPCSLLFVGATRVAVRQVRRGDNFTPASPLLWSVMDRLTRPVANTPDDKRETGVETGREPLE